MSPCKSSIGLKRDDVFPPYLDHNPFHIALFINDDYCSCSFEGYCLVIFIIVLRPPQITVVQRMGVLFHSLFLIFTCFLPKRHLSSYIPFLTVSLTVTKDAQRRRLVIVGPNYHDHASRTILRSSHFKDELWQLS